MVVDGTYKIEMDTPMGRQQATLTLKTNGHVLDGLADTPMGKKAFNGTANGNTVTWQIEIGGGLGSMKVEFIGTITGDELKGKAKAGVFGSFPFTGRKL